MAELKKRIEDLHYAISVTKTAFKYCDTPSLKDLYLQNIDYYTSEILIAESRMLAYTNGKLEEQ